MNSNQGFLANASDLHPNKGHFGCANTVTTGAEQYIPPYAGSTTSTTVSTWGILWCSATTAIEGYRAQFTGDAANAQTTVFKLYYLRGGVLTLIPGSTSDAVNTNAGQKNGGKQLTTPFTPVPGDVIVASHTPSAGLGAALTGMMVSLL